MTKKKKNQTIRKPNNLKVARARKPYGPDMIAKLAKGTYVTAVG